VVENKKHLLILHKSVVRRAALVSGLTHMLVVSYGARWGALLIMAWLLYSWAIS
jgi:hypothetical protein